MNNHLDSADSAPSSRGAFFNKNEARFASVVAALAIGLSLFGAILWLLDATRPITFDAAFEALGWSLAFTLTLAPLGSLIVTNRSGNKVGWLLLVAAMGSANPVAFLIPEVQPTAITPLLLLALWLDGWSWIPPIFALFLIPLYFPTGRLPTPRWRWLPWLSLWMWALFAGLTLLLKELTPLDGDWEPLLNPIGVVPLGWIDGPFMAFWFAGLLTLLGGSVLSLFVRYRRARRVERQQIKWLLLAGAQFVIVYSFAFFISDSENGSGWFNFMFLPSALAIPAAVAIAILRYGLYDIDVIIRKTAVYATLSALLALVYFGSVILLQNVLSAFTGQHSTVAIVLSTLLIAALFQPLRGRIQEVLDRRFYRQKYDRQQVLTHFGQTARDEVSLTALEAEFVRVVQETVQPEQILVWLKPGQESGGPF